MTSPVVITAFDQVSCLGKTLSELRDSIEFGQSGISRYDLDLPGIDPVSIPIGRVQLDTSKNLAPSKVPLDRGTALALVVTERVAAQSQLADVDLERLGVYWGSGMAGAHTFDSSCEALYGQHRRLRPTNVVTTMPNAPAAEIALMLKAKGANLSFACACASSAVALGEAMYAIRTGRLDVVLVGGSESMLTPGVLASWQAMRVLAPVGDDPATACKPFDAHRKGFALGEGAAAFVLESRDHALRRGAIPLAVLSGYGISSDGVHITNPDVSGQVRAMKSALLDAGLKPEDIGYINAHGTATQAGDLAESNSVGEVFGNHSVPISSTKALHGHLLGAGGAVELAIAIQSLLTQRLPIAANLGEVDPQIQLNLIKTEDTHARNLKHVMSNAFAFGGTNAVLIASANIY